VQTTTFLYYSQSKIESVFGRFQTSPLSIIPKPGRPGKFHIIQNLSFPHSSEPVSSINSCISSDLFPCSYGTFTIVSHLISHLPPGSQAAIRDISEAYCTVPLHPAEWPSLVIRVSPEWFAVDTCLCFGFGPSSGIYGTLAGAGTELLHAKGIGPISQWVDDHIFFRIQKEYLTQFNQQCQQTADAIGHNGGLITKGGHQWYQGNPLPDKRPAEFDEDHSFPLCDLSGTSARSNEDLKYMYCFDDINEVSRQLGIPWEVSKDVPFSPSVTYLGLVWNLDHRTVTLSEAKHLKYLLTISLWNESHTHTLDEVQKLHGKLLHATLVLPSGRAYLIHLEAMLAIFGDSPFKPRMPPHGTSDDLPWWSSTLSSPPSPLSIPTPHVIHDFSAFSDASSGVGIGITLNRQWQAWTLWPGWNTDGQDISWAESIRFKLLIWHIISSGATNIHFKVFRDNRGIIEGWWNGRSQNKPTNDTFKHIHSILDTAQCTVITRYVPSSSNPADPPSQGIYPPAHLRLPIAAIPHILWPFLENAPSYNPSLHYPTPHEQSLPNLPGAQWDQPCKRQHLDTGHK